MDDELYPERLGEAVVAYLARCRVRYVFGHGSYQPYFEHRDARDHAYRIEWFDANPRPACCVALASARMPQRYAHVAGFKHVAAVFGVDEVALRAAVQAERKRGAA